MNGLYISAGNTILSVAHGDYEFGSIARGNYALKIEGEGRREGLKML